MEELCTYANVNPLAWKSTDSLFHPNPGRKKKDQV